MKIGEQMKKRIGGVLLLAVVLTAVAACSVRKNPAAQSNGPVSDIPLAGIASAFGSENLVALNVTAGVTDVMMDTMAVEVADIGLEKVGQGLSADTMDDMVSIPENLRILSVPETALTAEDAGETAGQDFFGYVNLGIASVDGNLNVRKEPTTDSRVVGKMTNHAACEIIAQEGDWYQITSGNVEGYVSADYIITGDEAFAIAAAEVLTIAKVKTSTLRVREDATTESSILALVGDGEELIVSGEKDGWYEVEVDNLYGYVSGEYVEISQKLTTAQTIKELRYGNGVSDVRVDLVQYALQFVGNRYVWGGTSLTRGVDCSGFTMRVYEHYGVSLPHHSASQPSYGTRISASEARPGDLFFYGSGGRIGHVGIYIGNGQIVHASGARTGIKVSNAFYRTPICVVSYLP